MRNFEILQYYRFDAKKPKVCLIYWVRKGKLFVLNKSDHFELDLTEVSRGKAYFFYTDVRSGKVDR